jgi:hypothetical protein
MIKYTKIGGNNMAPVINIFTNIAIGIQIAAFNGKAYNIMNFFL